MMLILSTSLFLHRLVCSHKIVALIIHCIMFCSRMCVCIYGMDVCIYMYNVHVYM